MFLPKKSKCAALASLIALQLAIAPAFGNEKPLSVQESVQLKRISSYWKDKDFQKAKTQILDFLGHFPDSRARDHLHAMLGDLYFQENAYKEAAASYERIENNDLWSKAFLNYAHSLFELKEYEALVKSAQDYFATERKEGASETVEIHFLAGESLFRLAHAAQEQQQKESLLKQALPHFKALVSTKYEDFSLFPLAEIYKSQKEYSKAASYYTLLSKKYPQKEEEYLCQAALLQIHYDRLEAIQTFGAIFPMNGKRAKIAAFNYLSLQFQEGQYRELIANKNKALPYVPEEKMALVQFFIGKSYFALGEYREAVQPLESYVASQTNASDRLKHTLLNLIFCAKETDQAVVFDRSLEKLLTLFPQDPDGAKALLLRAQMYRHAGDFKRAGESLARIIQSFPEYSEKESLFFDYAQILFQGKNWKEARIAFLDYLSFFPKSSKRAGVFRELLTCSLEEIKESSKESASPKKRQFISDLEFVLSDESTLSEEERSPYRLLLIRSLYEEQRFGGALEEITAYMESYPKNEYLPQLYLLAALCHKELATPCDQFISFGEKALALNPDFKEKEPLHLELFNAYLQLASEANEEEQAVMMEKAAEHLYQCVELAENSIKVENRLWLANHYYLKAMEDEKTPSLSSDRATALLEKLLKIDWSDLRLSIDEKTLFLEEAVMQLADLLVRRGEPQKIITLLEALTEEQRRQPNLPWKFQRKAMSDLADSYGALGRPDDALKMYEGIIASSKFATSHLASAAILKHARLMLGQLKKEKKTGEDNPLVTKILNNLKDLQIHKNLYNEPVHLEAALEYADLRASFAAPDKRAGSLLFFLKRVREDFLAESDSIAAQYHATRKLLPEMDLLFQTYMKFIEAKIDYLEATAGNEAQDKGIVKEHARKSLANLEQAMHDPNSLTPYLREQAPKLLAEMKKSL